MPFVCGILLVACTPNVAPQIGPTPTPSLATAASADFSAAIAADIHTAGPALIAAERAASISQDRALLSLLWTADARIVDGRGTADPNDDYIWQGLPAILDRYALAVFPSPPPPLDDPTLPAAVITATTTSGDDDQASITHAGDRWRLVRRAGRWWLAELVYSTPD